MGVDIPGEMVIIYQDAFKHFDTKNCGMVPSKILGTLLRFVGENPSDAEVQDIVAEVDPNSIGSFKFPNFLAMMARKLDENSAEDEIRESFKVFDNDGNGFINRQELGYVMENLGENLPKEEIECLINEIDIDGDGQINYEEFYTMMSSK
eukprot:TRINITY_DN20831_c0_g1_i1.p1 TRINITY_DN20831_c0_g1~~TRINITY_DN20831_c0_g1_i1.p1  ORF type:complete len:150 (-),score=55.21 TRINITY_DN20831_c0_g1_i1:90-539(-)